MRFLQAQKASSQAHRSQTRKDPENRSPGKPLKNLSTQKRSKHRRHAHHQNQQRVHLHRFSRFKQVAHHRAGNHLTGACPQSLKEPNE
jgi:hypothetical protein